jgi:membrane-bound serine protease (ClpP class)
VGAPALVGQTGVARGTLSPEGQVLVQGELWRAVVRGAPIDEGSRVRVVDVHGLTLTVEKTGEGRAS